MNRLNVTALLKTVGDGSDSEAESVQGCGNKGLRDGRVDSCIGTENINSTTETDSSNPFFLHHGDNPTAMIVSKQLNGENYNTWKRVMMIALSA
ncbi:hypothetical protein SADUNF_Sadunf02G0115500 [Salix dunnii]|uniref:Retrotransposon Copia-like N-terminal domain-containing protein n=1 Tax=Salix dunnii TaxID=1413687 RepID=A0A835N7E6_9ROSI|nr:hypothetical protein SADUNF_Sadunf02G0115500 [Salix dunnii]